MQTKGKNLFIKANGISFCYDDLGEGTMPLIFIHGFPFDKSSWEPQIDFLKEKHRVIAYDNRGFGKSESGDETFSIDLFADDLIKLMDALSIDKAIVCGLSMGGYILLNAINRYPQRFQAIILSDTQCIADSPEGKEKRYNTIKLIEGGGLNDFVEGFIKNIFCKESHDNKKELVERIKKLVSSAKPASITSTLAALAARSETCSILGKINISTIILCGAEDVITPPAQSEFLHKNIQGADLNIIEKAGHMSNLEQPEKFNNFILNFIN